jgi:hypothetical protein
MMSKFDLQLEDQTIDPVDQTKDHYLTRGFFEVIETRNFVAEILKELAMIPTAMWSLSPLMKWIIQ